jgi:hypothetical protein
MSENDNQNPDVDEGMVEINGLLVAMSHVASFWVCFLPDQRDRVFEKALGLAGEEKNEKFQKHRKGKHRPKLTSNKGAKKQRVPSSDESDASDDDGENKGVSKKRKVSSDCDDDDAPDEDSDKATEEKATAFAYLFGKCLGRISGDFVDSAFEVDVTISMIEMQTMVLRLFTQKELEFYVETYISCQAGVTEFQSTFTNEDFFRLEKHDKYMLAMKVVRWLWFRYPNIEDFRHA